MTTAEIKQKHPHGTRKAHKLLVNDTSRPIMAWAHASVLPVPYHRFPHSERLKSRENADDNGLGLARDKK